MFFIVFQSIVTFVSVCFSLSVSLSLHTDLLPYQIPLFQMPDKQNIQWKWKAICGILLLMSLLILLLGLAMQLFVINFMVKKGIKEVCVYVCPIVFFLFSNRFLISIIVRNCMRSLVCLLILSR